MTGKKVVVGKEAELAAHVEQYLVDEKWQVYKEVQPFSQGKRADIVAVRGRLVWIIECKARSSFEVIEQALKWKSFAHYVSVAVPQVKDQWFFTVVCNKFGIGVMTVGDKVSEPRLPILIRSALTSNVTRALNENQKSNIAGSRGSYWTPFNQTVRNLKEYLKEHPGATMKEVVESVEHHYGKSSNARSSLSHWIRSGVIDGVRREKDGKTIRLFLS